MGLDCFFRALPDRRVASWLDRPEPWTYGRLRAAGPHDPDATDCERAWHGLARVLTGCDPYQDKGEPPLNFLHTGDQLPEGHELTSGHVLRAGAVAAVADALESVTEGDLRARYDAKRFAAEDTYPRGIWEDAEGAFAYLLQEFRKLPPFFRHAADRGMAVVVYWG